MKIIKKSSLFLGITVLLIPSAQGIDYEKQCEDIFLNNKTNHYLIISFCNKDHDEQQQYPLSPNEHRAVRVSAEMMKNLAMVKVTMNDPRPKKKKHQQAESEAPKKIIQQSKEIDYDRKAGIVGLEMAIISGELDLKWRHLEEYSANAPADSGM